MGNSRVPIPPARTAADSPECIIISISIRPPCGGAKLRVIPPAGKSRRKTRIEADLGQNVLRLLKRRIPFRNPYRDTILYGFLCAAEKDTPLIEKCISLSAYLRHTPQNGICAGAAHAASKRKKCARYAAPLRRTMFQRPYFSPLCIRNMPAVVDKRRKWLYYKIGGKIFAHSIYRSVNVFASFSFSTVSVQP